MERNRTLNPWALLLTILSGLCRLIPHPPNFTPVGGSSLFAGARIPAWYAYLIPILVMLVTDPLVGGFSSATPFVYASLLINVWIGRRLVRTQSPLRIGAAAFLCSLQFFLITNFAWIYPSAPHTWEGIYKSYVLALPFFGRTLAGDLFWTAVLFSLHALLNRMSGRESRAVSAQSGLASLNSSRG